MKIKEWEKYKRYFKPFEFDSPDVPDSGMKMKKELLELLFYARNLNDTPYIITSGYRTAKYNKQVGGVKGSSHMKGEAVDIKVKNSHQRFIILQCLIISGCKRIGVGKGFIHCDITKNKSQEVTWLY